MTTACEASVVFFNDYLWLCLMGRDGSYSLNLSYAGCVCCHLSSVLRLFFVAELPSTSVLVVSMTQR